MPETGARTARVALERLLEQEPTTAVTLPHGAFDRLERYVALLLDANARTNLTRVVAPAAIARLHLLDALSALPVLDRLEPASALDLGSGGGVPGIVLAIARPGVRWILVDASRRKAGALRSFAEALALTGVTVIADRAETLGQSADHRERYDLVTARACAPLPVLAEYALPLVRVGGSLLAWKGPMEPDEIADGSAAAAVLGGAAPEVRDTGWASLGQHRFVMVRKERATPPPYPRRPGQPARRPLG